MVYQTKIFTKNLSKTRVKINPVRIKRSRINRSRQLMYQKEMIRTNLTDKSRRIQVVKGQSLNQGQLLTLIYPATLSRHSNTVFNNLSSSKINTINAGHYQHYLKVTQEDFLDSLIYLKKYS